ncbi:hypothetical protein F5Y05DRAFT_288597 [Hypoxylon sp. FL0543]|nr:hypothetical protein F5Y05DRAFT_288597 [Hypoxylon sp. FL0543]
MGLSRLVKLAAAGYLWALSAQASASSPTTSGSITAAPTPNSASSSTSATSPSGTASSHVPGVTHLPDVSIILSVVPAKGKSSQHADASRDGVFFFIDATRPRNARGCADASPFNLTSGRLSRHAEALSADADVLYKPLGVSARAGAVSTTFSVVDGALRWYDSSFYGGRARYCAVGGLVYVVFHIEKTWPAGCAEVDLAVFLASQCRGGEILPGAPIVPTGRAETTGVAVTGTGTGVGMGAGSVGVGGGRGATATAGTGSWDEL